MTVRTGLQYLVDKIDSYIPTESVSFISDDEKQDILNQNRQRILKHGLEAESTFDEGSHTYLYYHSFHQNLEQASSGSAYFRMYNSGGTAIGTASFLADYATGDFTFSTNQENASLYIDCYSYDINGALADVWETIQANTSSLYDVQVEGRRYSRSQWFDHCETMMNRFKAKSSKYGSFQVPIFRSDYK